MSGNEFQNTLELQQRATELLNSMELVLQASHQDAWQRTAYEYPLTEQHMLGLCSMTRSPDTPEARRSDVIDLYTIDPATHGRKSVFRINLLGLLNGSRPATPSSWWALEPAVQPEAIPEDMRALLDAALRLSRDPWSESAHITTRYFFDELLKQGTQIRNRFLRRQVAGGSMLRILSREIISSQKGVVADLSCFEVTEPQFQVATQAGNNHTAYILERDHAGELYSRRNRGAPRQRRSLFAQQVDIERARRIGIYGLNPEILDRIQEGADTVLAATEQS